MKYVFLTEDGSVELSYPEYLACDVLRKKVSDKSPRRVFLNLGRIVLSYEVKWLNGQREKKKDFDLLREEQRVNPIRFYLPCCALSGFDSPAHQYINDDIHTITGIKAGNRYGKTLLAWIKQQIRRGIIKCDPKWEIFTEHGVKFREWDGPKIIGVYTYDSNNMKTTIWPKVIQAWTPHAELGAFKPDGTKWPNFQSVPRLDLASGSEIILNTYEQGQNVFESDARDGHLWDEQGEEPKFDGANVRTGTKRWWWTDDGGIEHLGSGWHDFSLTPHRLKDRPDTGANSFIHRMDTGEDTKGMSVKFYQGNLVEDTPDWVLSERFKAEQVESWITIPMKTNNTKRLAEGRSRLYGEWHQTTGLVYDDWSADIHMIDPFPIPADATLYRGLDHGKHHPFACVWIAALPDGDYVLFDCVTNVNGNVSDNVKMVVKRSRNVLKPRMRFAGTMNNRDEPMREVMCGMRIRQTPMDSRSFSKPQDNSSMTLGELYQLNGLYVTQASGQTNAKAIPIVSEFLRVDPERKHRVTKAAGAPRLYVFNTCMEFRHAIERYSWKDDATIEKTKDDQADLMDAFKYVMQCRPVYVPGFGMNKEKESGNAGLRISGDRKRDPITAY